MENKYSFKGVVVGIAKCLLYFAIYLFVQVIALNIIALIVGEDYALSMSTELTILCGCIAVLAYALVCRAVKGSLSEMAYINPMPLRFVLNMVFLGVATAYTIAVVLGMIEAADIFPAEWLEAQEDAYDDIHTASAVLQFLSVGLMAPLLEEILFRGLILGTLKKQMHPWIAIVLSAVMFGVAHGTPIGIMYATVLGVLMGWVCVKFNSILPTIILHMAYNCALVYSEGISLIAILLSVPILIFEIIDINKYFRGRQR